MADTPYRFGRCEVRPGRRQVLVDGQPRTLEPRPFDLLVYLIEHGDRVVSKQELLDAVWQREPVSPSAIAQAVKKVRQVIGDDTGEPTLVKTMHRAGYRFVGVLEARPAAAGEEPPGQARMRAAAAQAIPPAVVSLALLPFENRTGRPELGWIELGLMSLVAKALERDSRVSMPAIPLVLSALATLPAQAGVQERMDLAARLLGVRNVVHAAVDADGEALRLELRVGPGAGGRKIVLAGGELTALGEQAARALLAELSSAGRTAAVSLDFDDPLANQALARSLQAIGQEKWPQALRLLEVVLDIAPGDPGVLVQKLRVLVAMDSDAAFTLGAELLDRLEPGEHRLAAEIRLALGYACMRRRLAAEARLHLDAAMQAAGDRGSPEWLVAVDLLRASVALAIPDVAATRALLERLHPACDRDDANQLHRVRYLTMSAVLSAVSGGLAEALPVTRRTMELQRSLGMRTGLGGTLGNLAFFTMHMGRLGEAAGYGEESLALTREANSPTAIAMSAATLCRVHHLLRQPEAIARVVAIVDALPVDGARFSPAYPAACRALQASTLGRHAQAAELWREARDGLMQARLMLDHRIAFNDLASELFRAGRISAAMEACTEERARTEPDEYLNGSLLYWSGQRAFLQGDRMLACRHLRQAAILIPDGLWHANARLDAAWLLLEMDDPDAARALLHGIEPWLSDYPPGMAVRARMMYSQREFAAARDTQDLYLRRAGPGDNLYHGALAASYAQAARQRPAALPRLALAPILPTMA